MLICSAPSAWVIPERTPGRSGTCTRTPLERAGVAIGLVEQRPAVDGGLADPAGEPARVAALASARSRSSTRRRCSAREVAQLLGVVEEDVDPDPRVRAGDARHVPERAAGRRERLVPVHPHRAGVVEDEVREGVRQVARQRHEPVVRAGVDRHRDRAERGDEAVQMLVALGLCLGDRREEPRRALEELRARVLGATSLGAADRMAADEPRAFSDRTRRGRSSWSRRP